MWQYPIEAVRKCENVQAAFLPVIQQQVGQAGAGEIGIELLVIRAGGQAQRDTAGCPLVDVGIYLRIGQGHL